MKLLLNRLRSFGLHPRPREIESRRIDPKRRAGELTDQELIQGADAYFAKFTPDSLQYKKPFSDPEQSPFLAQHLGILLQAADLFRGAQVLDFGCATGWLSMGMAQMGCDVVGVDIAASALKLAERLKATRRSVSDGRMEFRLYDGRRLPAPDASFDRIVCSDAFHHVRDQAHVMREFSRVLKEGGRIAFVEPGPRHSRTEKSQDEMRLFKVLENDVSMREVAAYAQAAGLSVPEMLVQFQRPLQITLEEFQHWAEKGIPRDRGAELLRTLASEVTDAQFFFITKGQSRADSRKSAHLSGELRLIEVMQTAVAAGEPCVLRFAARNTGTGTWLTAAGAHGQVRLGAQLYAADGSLLDLDFARFNIEGAPVEPGAETVVEARLKLPEQSSYHIRFDLVAEHVAWFGQMGRLKPVEIQSGRLLGKV
jgi:2-polyprenyl-3-methyl-5-hydroxy-6-metoxy-1,4-benzoquinol methylase